MRPGVGAIAEGRLPLQTRRRGLDHVRQASLDLCLAHQRPRPGTGDHPRGMDWRSLLSAAPRAGDPPAAISATPRLTTSLRTLKLSGGRGLREESPHSTGTPDYGEEGTLGRKRRKVAPDPF